MFPMFKLKVKKKQNRQTFIYSLKTIIWLKQYKQQSLYNTKYIILEFITEFICKI